MAQLADPVTISVSRAVLTDISEMTAELVDKMHELLERNTQGELSATESAELETLVQMAEFGQIVSMALSTANKP